MKQLEALFNPSNDMALGRNVRQYFPPRRIQQMESDLASLARFWEQGPWGWSLATKQRYRRMGVAEADLPSDEWLEGVRRLSSREFGVQYYREMGALQEPALMTCEARYVTSVEDLQTALSSQESAFILKAPWSSSGRGNMVLQPGAFHETERRHAERLMAEQGGIVVEPFYEDKALDFAMEFQVCDEGVKFLGYSVFFADETGHYGGNYVESQEQLRRRLPVSDDLLAQLVRYHQSHLAHLPYRGPVGIDMMLLTDDRIHPCVEINFRMTMGLLAILLHQQGFTTDQMLAGTPEHGFSAVIRHGVLQIDFRA